ncbi:hypothetical protein BHM03_00013516 [Ensete ventricosum]|nr:hypothetical protein BHM03_00013516 [Ensete ventricosum]
MWRPPAILLIATWAVTALFASDSARADAGFPAKLRLERALPTRGVGLEHLRARDCARHGRSLLGASSSPASAAAGVVDFPVEGSSNPFTVGYLSSLYFTRVKLGNPAKEFYVQIDTGSDILWVTCNPCNGCPTSSGLNVRSISNFYGSMTWSNPCQLDKSLSRNLKVSYLFQSSNED